ncbi:MAG: hypothetical protein M0P07_04280 [Candidatus Methanomethylophilaceae archaeon]|nr:hypothetical protein [Candidatus Methanomethylophilaceae archaeon]MDD3378844.1 hypothetical protein [Candidatus Methanomethylophilaceae archaeon]
MNDAIATVQAGVCKFQSIITATMDDSGDISFKIESDCPAIKKLANDVQSVPMFDTIKTPFNDNPIYQMCGKYVIHAACPVPCGMVKAAEAAAGLGLKRDVSIALK